MEQMLLALILTLKVNIQQLLKIAHMPKVELLEHDTEILTPKVFPLSQLAKVLIQRVPASQQLYILLEKEMQPLIQ
jgi:hypothetical protein